MGRPNKPDVPLKDIKKYHNVIQDYNDGNKNKKKNILT